MRSKNIEALGNAKYNLVNGDDRLQVNVPFHEYYNPDPRSVSSINGTVGNVYGDGFAGRPLRGMDKMFGKRVVNANGSLV